MFELIFILGITAVGVAATVWFLRRDTKEDDICGGCTCGHKEPVKKVRKLKINNGG